MLEDSLKRYHGDNPEFTKEQSQIAFGDMKFGMSQTEANKASKLNYPIGGHTFSTYQFYTEDDELYFIQVYATKKTANYIDNELRNQWYVLRQTISDKYGEGDFLNSYPSIFDFSPGRMLFTHMWEIGTKVIKLGLSEEKSGSRYQVKCWIYNEPVYEAISQKQEEEKEQSLKRGSELF